MERETRLIKNTFILSFGVLLPRLATLITLPIYTARLTRAEFGMYELIDSMVLLGIPIITMQLHYAAFRFLIDCRESDDIAGTKGIISSVLCYVGLTSFISSCVVFLLLPTDIEIEIRVLIGLFFLIEPMMKAVQHILRGLGDNMTYSLSSIVLAAANVIFVVFLLAYMDMGLTGLLLSLNIALTIVLVFILIRTNIISYINVRCSSIAHLKRLLKYSVPMVPSAISLYAIDATSRVLAVAYMGLGASAVFGIAYKVPSLIRAAYFTFELSWHENASETYNDSDSDEYFGSIFRRLFSLISGFTAVLIAATPLLFKLLIQGDYSDAYSLMPMLFLGVLFSCLTGFYEGVYVSVKKTLGVGLTGAMGAVVNLIVCWAFISKIGLYAASVAMLACYFSIFIYRMIETRKWKKIKYNWAQMIVCMLVLIAMGALSFQRLPVYDIINAVAGVIFACVINREIIAEVLKKLAKKAGLKQQ